MMKSNDSTLPPKGEPKDLSGIHILLSSDFVINVTAFLGVQDLLRVSEVDKLISDALSKKDPVGIWKQVEDRELARNGQAPRGTGFLRVYDVKTHALVLRMQNEVIYCTNRIHALRKHQDYGRWVMCRYNQRCRNEVTDKRQEEWEKLFSNETAELLARRSNLRTLMCHPGEQCAVKMNVKPVYCLTEVKVVCHGYFKLRAKLQRYISYTKPKYTENGLNWQRVHRRLHLRYFLRRRFRYF
jgi:hypothetical protein